MALFLYWLAVRFHVSVKHLGRSGDLCCDNCMVRLVWSDFLSTLDCRSLRGKVSWTACSWKPSGWGTLMTEGSTKWVQRRNANESFVVSLNQPSVKKVDLHVVACYFFEATDFRRQSSVHTPCHQYLHFCLWQNNHSSFSVLLKALQPFQLSQAESSLKAFFINSSAWTTPMVACGVTCI